MDMEDRNNLKNKISQIYSNIFVNVDSIAKLEGLKKFHKNSEHFSAVIRTTENDITSLETLINLMNEQKTIDSRGFTLLVIFDYLLVSEGIICNFLNYICLLLMQEGHDLFSITRKKYVQNKYSEIMKTEFSTKLQFLNHHGFKELTKDYDSILRNNIAHHNYIIDEKGNLFVNGNKIDLQLKIKSLTNLVDFASEITKEEEKILVDIIENFEKNQKKTK